jgi:hypothetical protein
MTSVRWCTAALIAWTTAAAPAEEPFHATGPSQLVVMTDGRILEGVVTRQATGYYVERSNGRIVIPFEQVRCVARDLPDAYRQQRETMVDPTAADLIRLAEWCLSYRLYDEARLELNRALRRDGSNETARRMLARLEDMLLAKSPPPKPAVTVADGLLQPEVEALGGFSRPTAAQFTARIQPLLMNKCGNASCHGAAANNDFRLTPVRLEGLGHRRGTEQNLALVLKYVDVQQPHQSLLLEKIRKAHGGAAYAALSGAQGNDQQKQIRDWVLAVANERRAEEERLAQRTRLGKKPATTAAAVEPAVALASASETVETQPSATDEPETVRVAPLSSLPPRGSDRFDPAEFNQNFGNQPSRAARQ